MLKTGYLNHGKDFESCVGQGEIVGVMVEPVTTSTFSCLIDPKLPLKCKFRGVQRIKSQINGKSTSEIRCLNMIIIR